MRGARKITVRAVLKKLGVLGDPAVRAAMVRFGVHAKKALGISMPQLHRLAKEIGTDHGLAQQL